MLRHLPTSYYYTIVVVCSYSVEPQFISANVYTQQFQWHPTNRNTILNILIYIVMNNNFFIVCSCFFFYDLSIYALLFHLSSCFHLFVNIFKCILILKTIHNNFVSIFFFFYSSLVTRCKLCSNKPIIIA